MSGRSGTSISFQSAMNHPPEKEKYIFQGPKSEVLDRRRTFPGRERKNRKTILPTFLSKISLRFSPNKG